MPGPLDGLIALDFSSGMAGGLTGAVLADFGAEVTKVEPPNIFGIDWKRPVAFYYLTLACSLAGYFVCAGFNSAGIANSGGAGKLVAQWIVDGEAPLDLWDVDIRRFAGIGSGQCDAAIVGVIGLLRIDDDTQLPALGDFRQGGNQLGRDHALAVVGQQHGIKPRRLDFEKPDQRPG